MRFEGKFWFLHHFHRLRSLLHSGYQSALCRYSRSVFDYYFSYLYFADIFTGADRRPNLIPVSSKEFNYNISTMAKCTQVNIGFIWSRWTYHYSSRMWATTRGHSSVIKLYLDFYWCCFMPFLQGQNEAIFGEYYNKLNISINYELSIMEYLLKWHIRLYNFASGNLCIQSWSV